MVQPDATTNATTSFQGWLMKQKHGFCRTWLKRYFVLQGRELSYYRNETDKSPQNVLDLDHYTISFKKQSRRNRIFVLVADEHHMQPDYYLQAESRDELELWVSHLQQHMSTSSVLDKWLERLDMSSSSQHKTGSCTSLHVPSGHHQYHQQHSQQQQSSIRSHRSVESIHTFYSLPSESHRVSFTNDRRPSSQSTHSNSSIISSLSHASNSTANTTPITPYRTMTPSITTSATTCSSSSVSSLSSSSTSINGSKFFSSRLFSRKQFHPSSPLDSTPTTGATNMMSPSTPSLVIAATTTTTTTAFSSTDTLDDQQHDQEVQDCHHQQEQISSLECQQNKDTSVDLRLFSSCPSPLLVTPIIHPSEYNHDDDPQERLKLRQQQQQDVPLPRGHSCSNLQHPLGQPTLSTS
ncbi:uncharacterized protein BX664DRAFT_314480 [Halteromyces radiatus]|uniref:uncharacterized protein n=1 Tax=Halteromyces radiatus TaxID=101107 RepID=UPI00221E873D|nr:uncharacterized protein BX664DRAFT_314480 [Halteromyces radiatus]KAI8089264.1 hypothetical protein BX664DRAFT_314480 [Halteromyces radiatus]